MNGNHQQTLKAGLKMDVLALFICLMLALAFRLPGLTIFLTADEPRSWFGRSIIFLDSLARGDWANTGPGGTVPYIENVSLSPAPGVTTMWAGALGLMLEYWKQGAAGSLVQFLRTVPFDPLDPAMLFSLRLPGVLVAVAAVGLTYGWSRPLLGRWGAFLTAALIALDPFYLALSRVLGHDALVTTFMWLSLLAFLRAMAERPTNGRLLWCGVRFTPAAGFLIASGALAGLAFLSKYPALFIGAFIALAMLVTYLWPIGSASGSPQIAGFTPALARWARDMAIWSVAAGLVFVLLWPAMWVNPLGPLATIANDALRASGSSHQKGSFFLGQPVPDPGALFYPLVALLRTTPVILPGLLLSAWLVGRRVMDATRRTINNEASRWPYVIAILLAYTLLYTLLVTYGGKKQDRYLLPAFPAIAMLASMGYIYASQRILRGSRFTGLVPAVVILLQIALILPAYPYYFSYYNSLVSGGKFPTDIIQVGWGEGLNEAAAYLNTLPEAQSTKVVAWYSTTFEPYFKGKSIYEIEEEKISRSAKPGLVADYVVLYVNQMQRQLPAPGTLQFFLAASPVYTVTLEGIDYAWVYPSAGMQHAIAAEARLVGQAELLGYDLVDEAGQPVTTLYPESVAFLSLYWEWQGKAEDEPIQISLIDAEGNTRGWGNHIETVAPVPYDEWQEGMIVRDEFALVIFADTAPGQYRLSAWIDRPATGETVGVFPLGDEMIRVVPRQPG